VNSLGLEEHLEELLPFLLVSFAGHGRTLVAGFYPKRPLWSA